MAFTHASYKLHIDLITTYWYRSEFTSSALSIDDVVSVIATFFNPAEVLQWSDKWMSGNGYLKLTNEKRCVERHDPENFYYEWIMPDIETVHSGRHCWRVHVHNPATAWIFFGVSPRKMFNSSKYKGPSQHENVWGIGKYGHNIYPSMKGADKQHNNAERKIFYECIEPFDVDMLLDVDQGELCICVVGHKEKEFKLWNMPLNTSHGWIPLLSTEGSKFKTTLMIARIECNLYGEFMDELFIPF